MGFLSSRLPSCNGLVFSSIPVLSFASSRTLVWVLGSFRGCFLAALCPHPAVAPAVCLAVQPPPPGDFCRPPTLTAPQALTADSGSPYVYFEPADCICLLVLLKMEFFPFSLLLLSAVQEQQKEIAIESPSPRSVYSSSL